MSTSIDNLGLVVNIIDSFRIHTKDIVDRYDREILGTFKPNGAQLLEDFIKNNFSSSEFAGKLDACYSLDFVKVYVNLFEQELENKVSEICFLSNFINALFWLFMVFIFALLLIMDMFVANIHLFVRDLFNYNRIIYSTLILFWLGLGLWSIYPALIHFRNYYVFRNRNLNLPQAENKIKAQSSALRQRKMKD